MTKETRKMIQTMFYVSLGFALVLINPEIFMYLAGIALFGFIAYCVLSD